MPTLEERLDGLERALTTSVRQIQQQIAEQRRERDMVIGHLGQVMNQRFDTLEKALIHQFGLVNARFETQDAWSRRMEQHINQHIVEIRQKFDTSDHFATRTYGIVSGQERDIHDMKEDIRDVKGRLNTLENKVDEGFSKVDERFSKVDERFDKMDERFDQVISLLLNKKG